MVSKGSYPRWLKDVDTWTPEDDWEADEYLQWMQRLADAKKNLKQEFENVDTKVEEVVFEACKSVFPELPEYEYKMHPRGIARYIIAYNFYARAYFENTPDNQVVMRVKKYLAKRRMGMNVKDIARMLQAAADKVRVSYVPMWRDCHN